MGRQRKSSRWSGLAADITLLLTVLFAPLAIGSVLPWAHYTLVALCGLACLFTTWDRAQRGRVVTISTMALLPLSLALLCALQLLPLPPFLLNLLSPSAHDILSTSLKPLGTFGWEPSSLDPPATSRELGKALLYLMLFVAAFQRSREKKGGSRLLTALAISGVAVLTVSMLQTLGRVETPYGIFGQPSGAFLVSTFINPNNAAGFFGLTAFAAGAIALTHPDRVRAGMWGLASILLAVAVVLTMSRGGILALVATLLFGLGILLLRKRGNSKSHWVLLLGIAGIIGTAVYVAYNPLVAELSTLNPNSLQGDKSYLWKESISLAPRFWLTGVGHGAFSRVFPVFKINQHVGTFDYAESAPIQWLVDMGLVAGSLIILSTLLFFVVALRNAWRVRRLVALCGLFFVLVHNVVDFNTELLGISIPLLFLVVVLCDRHGRLRTKEVANSAKPARLERWVRGRLRLPAKWLLAPLAACWLLSGWTLYHGLSHNGERLDSAIAKSREPAELARLGIEGLNSHPADYLYALTIARSELLRKKPNHQRALRWLNRAMYLNPTYGPSHSLAAQTLWRLGAIDQALSEWRMASAMQPTQRPAILRYVLTLKVSYPQLARVIAEEDLMVLCHDLYRNKRQVEAKHCVEDRLAAEGEDFDAVCTASTWALREGALDRAGTFADKGILIAPTKARGYLAKGQVALSLGNETLAADIWQTAVPKVTDPWYLLSELFNLALRQKRYADARLHLDAYRKATPPDRSLDAQASYMTGRLYEQQRLYAKALREFERAATLQTSSYLYLEAKAHTERHLGYLDKALRSYKAMLRYWPSNVYLKQCINQIEQSRKQKAEEKRRRVYLGQ